MPQSTHRFSVNGARVEIFERSSDASEFAADQIRGLIQSCLTTRGKVVLGLATGSTPEPVYARLVEAHQAGSLSFEKVTTFNLDEYYPMSPLDPQSYRSYMHRHLFAKVDIPPHQAHLLDGTVPEAFVNDHTAQFDQWIKAGGGLDFQLLGLGRNGHIGFNEPSNLPIEQALKLSTRIVELHPMTIADAVKDFGSEALVPRRALTMGVASILEARSILILAFGERKASAVARSLQGPITAEVPGSLLQTVAGQVTWLLDTGSASQILR